MSQQFCLKWNNHTTNMLQVFENLLTTEALVDVTLACDGLSLKAHKMVLSACSPFFQSLFLENPCKHPIVIMKDMRYCDLKAIIDFMYRGEVNVSHDQLSALLKTAETLKVKGLAEVTGENKQASGIVQQEIVQNASTSTPIPIPPSAQRTDTPPLAGKRKRGRPRKRSLSDSNRSDDEGVPPKIKETNSDVEELSCDASMEATSDNRGGGPLSCNSQSQVPIHSSNNVNTFSKTHLSSSQDPQGEEQTSGDENEFEVEPSKLLEQTLTTENVPSNSQNSTGPITLPSVSGLEISRRSMSSTDSVSQALVPVSIPSDSLGSNLQGPDSPQDVKPQILSFDDPPISPVAGTSHGSDRSLMMYMDQSGVASIPGPSNFQDNSALVPHDSQPQDFYEEAAGINIRINNAFNHSCETTRLLQELREDPTCFCDINNDSFEDTRASSCSEIEDFMHKNPKNSPRKSKQLLIFNEEGCMRGIEVNKEINSEALSSLNNFQQHFLNTTEEEDDSIIIVEDFHSEAADNSNSSTMEKEQSFPNHPRELTASNSTNCMSLSSMPQFNPRVTLERIDVRKKRRRRHKKKLYFTTKKTKVNPGAVPRASEPEEEKHSVPCSVPFKQSYTQVSVEEVHLAQSKRPVGRPRKTTNPKTANEMLMLKRKIVQSTSIEYQSNKFHSQQFHSNLAAGVSFNHNFSPRSNGTIAKQHQEKGLVRYTRGARFSRELEKYGPDALPPGWCSQVVTRKSGKTAGQIDIYFITPDRKKIRSRNELASYIEKNDLPFMAEEFCFRRSAYN